MMMMMKNPIVLVTCVILLSSLAVLAYPNSFGPDECCFKFVNSLPKRKVATYKYTDEQCPMSAVIFTMKKGRQFCANQSEKWVQDIISFIQNEGENSSGSN
ncbi:C-C motif chemokine 5-like [Morone saxatilis]|uniref:C-C motif chemokine 5-like n=1 Tax=Morone saxatilis TaxID=34816 RepID=UPI0015E1D7CD|nr:C-C motif chemokine 5-like [Morone saxatilis]